MNHPGKLRPGDKVQLRPHFEVKVYIGDEFWFTAELGGHMAWVVVAEDSPVGQGLMLRDEAGDMFLATEQDACFVRHGEVPS